MKTVRYRDREFREMLTCLEHRGRRDSSAVEEPVKQILQDVQQRGDEAVAEYTERFDRVRLKPAQFPVSRKEVQQAYRKVPREVLALFEESAARVRAFHQRQRAESWFEASEDGTLLGQLVTPIGRVGLYVPGGKAAYPSSVLMNAIPAQVAGVRRSPSAPRRRRACSTRTFSSSPTCSASRRSTASGAPRRSGRWPTARRRSRGWTRSSGRATSTWRPRRRWFSAKSTST